MLEKTEGAIKNGQSRDTGNNIKIMGRVLFCLDDFAVRAKRQ